MDFLDPKRKKAHRKRLLLGYFLTGIAITMATLILLFSAYGFDIDRRTGTIIQNGTVFVDSQPVSADVYLDDVRQNTRTAMRLVIPGGQYSLKLINDAYREWNRTFSVDGGKIERINYPILVPKTLNPKEVKNYTGTPAFVTQSLNQRWLLVKLPGEVNDFDLYDLNDEAKLPVQIAIPDAILTNPGNTSSFELAEWSTDDQHVILKRNYENKNEFIIFNIASPNASLNINTLLGVSPVKVSFRNNKSDQLYIFDTSGGILRAADTKNRTITGPLLSNVISYAGYGADTILYATKDGADAGKVNFRIRVDDKTSFLLKPMADGTVYLLAVNEFANTPYFVVGTNAEDAVAVYKDPVPSLRGLASRPQVVSAVIRLGDPQFVSFAPKNQFIIVQKGSELKAYDIFSDRQYHLELKQVVDSSVQIAWLDSHHLKLTDNSTGYIVDFDGFNSQALLPAHNKIGGPYFTQDLRKVYSLGPSSATPGSTALIFSSLLSQ